MRPRRSLHRPKAIRAVSQEAPVNRVTQSALHADHPDCARPLELAEDVAAKAKQGRYSIVKAIFCNLAVVLAAQYWISTLLVPQLRPPKQEFAVGETGSIVNLQCRGPKPHMSQLGQQRSSNDVCATSAITPTAARKRTCVLFAFVPKADQGAKWCSHLLRCPLVN
jgi:hypothetical protein